MAQTNVSGPFDITNGLVVGGTAHITGALTLDAGSTHAGGTIAQALTTVSNLHSLGTIGAISTITAGGLMTAANIHTAGTVGAAGITSSALVTGANMRSAGTIGADGAITGASVTTAGAITGGGGTLTAAGVFSMAGTMLKFGTQQMTWSGTIPVGGPWYQGNFCLNANPAPAGQLGWICTAAGSPGTWKACGTINA